LLGCYGGRSGPAGNASDGTAATGNDVAPAAAAATVPAALKLLKVEPVRGYAGDSFTVSGEGLMPGKQIGLFWTTAAAAYRTRVTVDNVEYHERSYEEKRVRIGSADTDAHGRFTARLVAPEDFGELHDLYAVTDGQDVARGGFRILRSASIAPSDGPVGTPITITVKGLGWRGFEQFMALRYDNKYTGELSAVTTQGTAVFQIRAAGAAGKHIIQLNNSTAYAPGAYLNTQQSPQAYIYSHLDNQQEFRFAFKRVSLCIQCHPGRRPPAGFPELAGPGPRGAALRGLTAHDGEPEAGIQHRDPRALIWTGPIKEHAAGDRIASEHGSRDFLCHGERQPHDAERMESRQYPARRSHH
jgi:hypothetical protein